jgi:hypothetical protein
MPAPRIKVVTYVENQRRMEILFLSFFASEFGVPSAFANNLEGDGKGIYKEI